MGPKDAAEYDLARAKRLDGSGRPLSRYQMRVEGNRIKVGPAPGAG